MSSTKEKEDLRRKKILMFPIGILLFFIGYYLLYHLSYKFLPESGANTFFVIFGCLLIVAGIGGFVYAFKEIFFPKKRKKRKKVEFLKKPNSQNNL